MSLKDTILIDPAGTVREFAIDFNGRVEYGPCVLPDCFPNAIIDATLAYLKSEASSFHRRYMNEKRSADDDASLYYKGKSDAFLEAYATVREFCRHMEVSKA